MPWIYTTNLIKFPEFFQMKICHSISEVCAVLCLVTQSCLIFVTPWARQDPQSMGFSRQEYWTGVTLCIWWAELYLSSWKLPGNKYLILTTLISELNMKSKHRLMTDWINKELLIFIRPYVIFFTFLVHLSNVNLYYVIWIV